MMRFASPGPTLLSSLLVVALAGCDASTICLNCGGPDYGATRDFLLPPDAAGSDDGGPDDGFRGDLCVPMPEVCNGKDDDCDGIIDNVPQATLCMDPNNCGACGRVCAYPHAYGTCGGCTCSMGACQPGFYDLDRDPANGCEYACIPTPPGKCASAADCPFGLPCSGGLCALACKVDGDCPGGTVCDPDTRLCEGEICDGVDNNCNGQIDEGFDLKTDPANCGGCNIVCQFANAIAGCSGGVCALGRCKPGFYDLNGNPKDGCEYACVDANKAPIAVPLPETCNGVDDDCNGVIDDHLTDVGGACDDLCPALAGCVAQKSCGFALSSCAGHCCGVCTRGVTLCAGGQRVCQGGAGPKLEVCNGVDDNCDGQIDEGFDLKVDPVNCGACGHLCSTSVGGGDGHAVWKCAGAACAIASCRPGFADIDGRADDGCEYACPVNPPTVETCNGKDDDCDGVIDNHLTQPNNFCVQVGPCSGAKPTCNGAKGWLCNYAQVNPKLELDANGNLLFTEKKCDGIDGNCNGQIDESFANLGKACFVGQGPCQGSAKFICDPNDASRTTCPATADAMKAIDETCNGIDDDCDGTIDERTPANNATCYNGGAHPCKGWVDAAVSLTFNNKTLWVYQYEASRVDATAKDAGAAATRACSRAGVLPWAPVTQTQASDACAAIKDGKGQALRLCTADEWSAACSLGVAGNSVWAFASNPTIYNNGLVDNSKTCNGLDQGLGTAWTTGAGVSCLAKQPNGNLYDLSGNVAEWTSTSVTYMGTTYYKVRGGAYNNFSGGLACNFDFVIEAPSYQLGDLGFRCCADNAP